MSLAESSLPYRRPELYDELHHDPDHTAARQQEALIDQHQPDARTVLDIGCGTGSDLAYHARRFVCTGVDVQPQMIAYARQRYPALNLHVGDMRSIRLGRAFDVILSVGMTPSYLLDDADLAAAFTTFAAHAHSDTLLILQALDRVPAPRVRTFRVDTPAAPAEVTVEYTTPGGNQTVIMNRTWRLDDGTVARDRIRRRVLTEATLEPHLARVGFIPLQQVAEENRCIVARRLR